jgi:hypothetical protein
MRSLDHLRKFYTTVADGVAKVCRPPALEHDKRDRNDQRVANTMPTARDEENRAQQPKGSYPAVWPR